MLSQHQPLPCSSFTLFQENSAHVNFTFWVWFDGILTLVKTYLENMWRDGVQLEETCILLDLPIGHMQPCGATDQ
ncbi:hypothetical protein CRUP_014328 [Coryphaenoides rupestris]|nr:hypothetical protein CRUP_014328 [Coryphaenoides rupestris]